MAVAKHYKSSTSYSKGIIMQEYCTEYYYYAGVLHEWKFERMDKRILRISLSVHSNSLFRSEKYLYFRLQVKKYNYIFSSKYSIIKIVCH